MAGRKGDVVRARAAASVVILAAAVLAGVSGSVPKSSSTPRPLSTVEAALQAARESGAPVAIPAMTTPTLEYAALPSGELRVRISAGVVRVRQGSGWVPVNLTLVRSSDGAVSPIAHPGELRISGTRPDGAHELAAVGEGDGRVAMGWTGPLPEPRLNGEKATYVDALPGVDLVVAATRTGFTQSLVVKDRAAVDRVASVRLTLTGPGITGFNQDTSGTITLTGAVDQPLATVPALRMWDARTGPAGLPLRSAPITTTVERTTGGVALGLSPDLGWIRDPATVFPVTLDPTVNPVSTTFDTYVRETETTDRSTQNDLQLGLLATTPPTLTRSFLTWDASVLAGKQITAATVSFFSFWSHTCEPRGWKIWTAGAASAASRWDTQPALTQAEAESTATTGYTDCPDAWVSIDGTSFFQRAAASGATAAPMAITASDETDVSGFKQFRSRDATNTAEVPYASVVYNAYPVVASRATTPATTCVTGTGRPSLQTMTPTLRATVSDPEGSALSVRFEWRTVTGTTNVGSSTVSAVASGGTATLAVPAGGFPLAGSYRWRVVVSDGTGAITSSWCEFTLYEFAAPADGCSGVAGDLDADGVRDTVLADPRATVDGLATAGAVYVISGATGAVSTLHQNLTEVPDTAEPGDGFGHALAVYDANRDGCADLAVSAPYEDVDPYADAGGVWVLLGSPAGLGKGPAAVTVQQGNGTGDSAEAEDWFGYALAAGTTTAGESYLAIGVPGEDVGTAVDAGAVHYLRGTLNVILTQDTANVPGAPETDDRFGFSVAGSPSHLAVGAPGESLSGRVWAGTVDVFTQQSAADAPTYAVELHQDVTGVSNGTSADEQFGKSVAMAAYRPAGATQVDSLLAVGVPGEDVTVSDVVNPAAGMVHRFHLTGTTFTELSTITYDSEDGDALGERLVMINTDPSAESTSQNLFLAVSTPGEDRTAGVDVGVVRVFGAAAEPAGTPVSVERGTGKLPGTQTPGELLGLAIGANSQYLFVASPYQAGVVYAIAWSSLAAGTVTPTHTWQSGAGGLPAGGVSFGEATA